ncbi:unnamed protein product [Boreogadus saida]
MHFEPWPLVVWPSLLLTPAVESSSWRTTVGPMWIVAAVMGMDADTVSYDAELCPDRLLPVPLPSCSAADFPQAASPKAAWQTGS